MFFPSVELEVFCDFNIFTFLDIDSYCFPYGPEGMRDDIGARSKFLIKEWTSKYNVTT